MPKVSVIIPVYNGEVYLRQCLDSVCAQTLEDIEIICVDDGSTDASLGILEEYRERDKRFRLFQQENLYSGAARNNGLAHAQGKYVIFWDCDDFFEPNALEVLYQRAEETEAEICVCNNDMYDNMNGKRYPDGKPLDLKRIPEGDTFDRFSNPEHILTFTNGVIWNKLFLMSFLIENDIKFPDYQYGQDRPFTFIALCLASKITTINEILIHYRWNNSESLVGKVLKCPQEAVRSFEYTVDQMIERDIVPTKSIGRWALQIFKVDLLRAQTEADFISVLNMWTEGGDTSLLQKCNIVEREPGYYYNANDDEYVRHLLHDKPGDLLAYMKYEVWLRNRLNSANRRRFKAELKEKKEELREVRTERKALKAELKETRAEQKETKARLKETKAELKETRAEQKETRARLKETKAELKEARAELKRTKRELEALRNSLSYRLGRALLFIPRKIRDLFRRFA